MALNFRNGGSETPEWWLSFSGQVAQNGPEYSEINNSDVDTFYDEKRNIEIALTDYLTKEKNRLTLKEGLKEEFLKKLQNFPQELSKKDSRDK